MKAISLWQPWATWVALGLKTIETRRHDRFKGLVGQRIVIHSAKRFDNKALEIACKQLWDRRDTGLIGLLQTIANLCKKTGGGYLEGTVYVWNYQFPLGGPGDSRQALCDCNGFDLHGLYLKDFTPFKGLIPWRGWQGIFEVPDKIIREVSDGDGQHPQGGDR